MKNIPNNKIDINEINLKNRNLFLFKEVSGDSISLLIQSIFALDSINHNPINLWLNSPGGSCTNGLALVNAMRQVKSPIITIINSEVCSMGSHISVAGDYRKMVWNGFWMAHDACGGTNGDYFGKVVHRVEALKKLYDVLEENYRIHTNLTEEDLVLAKNGELWLTANECLEKGIIDEIVEIA